MFNLPLALLLFLLLTVLAYSGIIMMANRLCRRLVPYRSKAHADDAVSVIIAARNEEMHISHCIESVLQQSYPAEKLEIIVVDDHSEDKTAEQVRSFAERGVRLISLGKDDGLGKKAAISKGIAAASHDYIVTTDADCTHPSTWIKMLLSYRKETDAVMVAAPVMYGNEKSFLDRFQSLDFIALQGITMAGQASGKFQMCNGANLLYSKSAFDAVNGFEGIDHIASGDDMLLMEKMVDAFPGKVHYCYAEEAIVVTEPASSWMGFLQQRIRWASKSTDYSNAWIKLVLLIVYLVNLSVVVLLMAGLWNRSLLLMGLFLIIIKTSIELPFMIGIARFFGKSSLLPWFIPMQPLHALYTVAAGTFGFFKNYQWKGRSTS